MSPGGDWLDAVGGALGDAQREPRRASSAADILAEVQADRLVVQDFTPLAESLDWELGQLYLHERGSQAFIGDPEPVPWLINNDGTLSVNAAEVFFASLLAAERDGSLEPDIFVLELGIGVGLFARFFLDHFRDLCTRHGKDFYDRLIYVAGDRSPKMLRDAGRQGIFANHAGRYVLRVIDALCPERGLANDPLFEGSLPRPFRAVFLNYLLDCLPAAFLRVGDEGVSQLCVRTCVARRTDLREFVGTDISEIRRLAKSSDPSARQELLAAYPALVAQYDFRPVDPTALPHGEFAFRQARQSKSGCLLHSYGAIQSLERLLGLLRGGGFVLMNDYGQTQAESPADFEHQRFSQATFVGVNFPLMRAYCATLVPDGWAEIAEEGGGIHARLAGGQVAPEAVACFRERFGKADRERLEAPVQRARALAKAGRLEAALTAYREALEEQPFRWPLMHEIANFLAFPLGNPHAALAIAKAALTLNPSCSADLWNTLGDCLFALNRTAEARHAYLRALRVRPGDVRARYNLSFVHAKAGEFGESLRRIAEALELDRGASLREALLRQQTEVLNRLAAKHRREIETVANRVSSYPVMGATAPPVPNSKMTSPM
jgi:tetratricopeptide (TPR) repeat protein